MDDLAKPPTNSSPQNASDGESLETPGTSVAPVSGGESLEAPSEIAAGAASPQPEKPKNHRFRALWQRVNIYLLGFVLVVVLGGVVVVVAYLKNTHENPTTPSNPATQNLSPEALEQLANNGTTIGDAKHVLNIQSNSIFAGTVLVRGNLEVAGTVKMGGTLALQGLTVSGTTALGQLQAKGLSVAGNTAVQGQLTAQSLSVAGSGNFNGAVTAPSIATNSLQLSGDLGLTHHIDTGGGVPGRANGGALGAGGTSSVSGSDTAGSISIHTGGHPAGGCFTTVHFVRAFGATPHVVITPVGSAAAGLNYYITRSTGSFSVCTTNSAPSGASFGFDYIVLD